MSDQKEIVTVNARIVKELPATFLVALERNPKLNRIPEPHPTRKKLTGNPLSSPLRRNPGGGSWANGRLIERPRIVRVPRSKVLAHGLGTMTLPRWVAVQHGLI